MSNRKLRNDEGRLDASANESAVACAVCAGVATGNHYSVPSCNGCKTFFRRAMVNERNFVCEGNGDCPVNKGVRCACRACRLAKCLSVGMNPESIQSERDRIGYTKRVRKETTSTSAAVMSSTIDDDSDTETNIGSLGDVHNLDNSAGLSGSRRHSMRYIAVLDRLTQLENSITLMLINDYAHSYRTLDEALEAPSVFLRPLPYRTEDTATLREKFIAHLSNNGDGMALWRPNVVALYIDWAKTFTVFRKLPKSDKIALLTNHFGSYIIMCEVRDVVDISTGVIIETHSQTLDTAGSSTSKASGTDRSIHSENGVGATDNSLIDLSPLVKIVKNYVTDPFENLGLSTSEFAALQAIMFFDPDADNLDAASQRNVSAEQKKYVDALNEYLNDHYPPEEAGRRFGTIILRVSTIRKIAAKKKDSLKLLNVFNLTSIDEFVKEMALGGQPSE